VCQISKSYLALFWATLLQVVFSFLYMINELLISRSNCQSSNDKYEKGPRKKYSLNLLDYILTRTLVLKRFLIFQKTCLVTFFIRNRSTNFLTMPEVLS
jgi:hypothetical protein